MSYTTKLTLTFENAAITFIMLLAVTEEPLPEPVVKHETHIQ